MESFDALAKSLQPHYSHFNVANRLLFTGHSHQAWPDVAFEGVQHYMQMVAEQVDNKWGKAFEKTEEMRGYLREWYEDPGGYYCREQNTHVLITSWLSALNLPENPHIITTTGEFHSMYRQLRRLQEEGIGVEYLPHESDKKLAEAIQAAIQEKTAAVMLSHVYFETAEVNTGLKEIARICRKAGVPLLVDDYHGTNVVPLSVKEHGLEDAFILIGGYKYMQWGEGNCFLRFPKDCDLRPALTGWFAAFSNLDEPRNDKPVPFDEGDQRFATATYDPVSQYRGAAVTGFFRRQGLTREVLVNQYRDQVQYLRNLFDEKQFEDTVIRHANVRPIEETGGFLALESPHARQLRAALLEKGIFTDARDTIIRFGPAPYTDSSQCRAVIEALEKAIGNL